MTAVTQSTDDFNGRGLFSARPTAGIKGRQYFAYDTGNTYRDNGLTWDLVDSAATGSALTVREVDGSPTDAAVTEIVFPNGTVSITSHVATISQAPARGFIGCRLKKTGAQTVSGSTETSATFDAEDYDTDGFHDTVTNNSRITIPVGLGGKYLLTGYLDMTGTPSTTYAQFRKNGSTYWSDVSYGGGGGVSHVGVPLVAVVELNDGDYVELRGFSTSTSFSQSSTFSATRLNNGGDGSGSGSAPYSVRGGVTSAGAVRVGTGFTVSRAAAGRYDIAFVTPFSVAPAVALGVYDTGGASGGTAMVDIITVLPTTSSIRVLTLTGSGTTFTDLAFDFVAIEPGAGSGGGSSNSAASKVYAFNTFK